MKQIGLLLAVFGMSIAAFPIQQARSGSDAAEDMYIKSAAIALQLLDDREIRKAFLNLMAVARVAARRCDNMRLTYLSLSVTARLSDFEPTADVDSEISQRIPAINGMADVIGAPKWCTAIWNKLGPSGDPVQLLQAWR